jgi:hypothetical protein
MAVDLLVIIELAMSGLSGRVIVNRLKELPFKQSNETTTESESS